MDPPEVMVDGEGLTPLEKPFAGLVKPEGFAVEPEAGAEVGPTWTGFDEELSELDSGELKPADKLLDFAKPRIGMPIAKQNKGTRRNLDLIIIFQLKKSV